MKEQIKQFKITEILQIVDGKKIVKYRRKYNSVSAKKLIKEVKSLPSDSKYFYRHI